VPTSAEPLSHKTQLAGAALGSGALSVLDPVTGAINVSKAALTNPLIRQGLQTNPMAGRALQQIDKTFVKNPITQAYHQSQAGHKIHPLGQAVRTFGLNAATAEAAATANRLGHAAKPITTMTDMIPNGLLRGAR